MKRKVLQYIYQTYTEYIPSYDRGTPGTEEVTSRLVAFCDDGTKWTQTPNGEWEQDEEFKGPPED